MFKNLLEFLCNNIFALKPILRFNASGIGNYCGINFNQREIPIIVSISHDNQNFDDLELSLYSLLNKRVCPDKIILWLNNEYELSDLPYKITRYLKNGLEIRFCENISPYTKLIKPMQEYSNSIIVTAESDIYYPKDWLGKLYHSYISSPKDIHVNRVQELKLVDNNIAPYKDWERYPNNERTGYDYFPDNAGGILYPPKCFVSDAFRKDIYSKYAQNDYNMWIWFMALISGRKIRLVKSHIKIFIVLDFINKIKKTFTNENLDNKIRELMKLYGQNIIFKLKNDYIFVINLSKKEFL